LYTMFMRGWGHGSSGRVCLANGRPWVQTPVLLPPKTKQTNWTGRHVTFYLCMLSPCSKDVSQNGFLMFKSGHQTPLFKIYQWLLWPLDKLPSAIKPPSNLISTLLSSQERPQTFLQCGLPLQWHSLSLQTVITLFHCLA
jgi:hypothetical protein